MNLRNPSVLVVKSVFTSEDLFSIDPVIAQSYKNLKPL